MFLPYCSSIFIVYDDKEGLVTNKLSVHAILNQVRCVHAAKIHLLFRITHNNSSKSHKNSAI